MQFPLQITFHGLRHSDALEARIRAGAEKLEKFSAAIIACRVVVEAPHRHHAGGNAFRIRLELTVPGDTLVASREADEQHAHTDPYVAVRDAFDAMRRLLQDYERRSGAHAGGRHQLVE